jgi:hypothetical protein
VDGVAVIATDVVICDLEPVGFGVICALAEARQRRGERVVSVLHDAGRVVHAVCSRDGVLDVLREPFQDAQQRAAALLAATGADRVVLYDRTRADELAADLARIPFAERTQLEVFWDNADAFWSSPAIATAPAPPANPWRALPRLLQRAEGAWAMLALYDGDACAATLLARVEGGRVSLLTSLDHLDGATRPPRHDAAALVTQVEQRLGPVRLGLICDVDRFGAALLEDDVPAAVARLARDGAIWSVGLADDTA